MNNKGFAVSAVLYTLLIAFLLFLGAALAMFSASSSLVSNANNDLINGNRFAAQQVKGVFAGKTCKALGTKTDANSEHYWYEGDTLVRINSRYGTMYWPRDFGLSVNGDGKIEGTYKDNKNVEVKCVLEDGSMTNCVNYDLTTEQGKEPEPPVTPEKPPLIQKMVTMVTEDDLRLRINYVVGDDWGNTCPQTGMVSISEDSYYGTVDLIKSIENFESIEGMARPDLSITTGEATCFSGNINYDPSSGTDVCDNNWDAYGFEEQFEIFETHLENLPGPSSGTTYEYDRNSRIFTQKIKMTIFGQTSYITLEYFPVIYKFVFYDEHLYVNDCDNGKFNTMYYYDLVPLNKLEASVAETLQISGKDVDQFALYMDTDRVGSYFFNSGEYDKAYEDGTSSSNGSTVNPNPSKPIIKPKSFGNLYIKDKLTTDTINNGKFSLYDICE